MMWMVAAWPRISRQAAAGSRSTRARVRPIARPLTGIPGPHCVHPASGTAPTEAPPGALSRGRAPDRHPPNPQATRATAKVETRSRWLLDVVAVVRRARKAVLVTMSPPLIRFGSVGRERDAAPDG